MRTTRKTRVVDEFINIASHEMKTPVQSILTYSELLHTKPSESRSEYIEAIYRNALRLQTLSQNLLDVTRIDSQALLLEYEKFDLNALIFCIIQDFLKRAKNSGTKTKDVEFLFIPERTVTVEADKDRISQVISNLLDNALKFTPKGEITIEVNTRNYNETVIVSVKDSGSGINPRIASSLFSKFITGSDNGVGLGLYISKGIIEAHDGKIWADNNPNNLGATFSFEIPCKNRIGSLSYST